MKLLSRSSYLLLSMLLIFLSRNAIAGTCDDCAACNNDIKSVKYISQIQKIISSYQCFKNGDKYVLNFVNQVDFADSSKTIVIKPDEGHVLEINNLNLGEAVGVDKELFLIIEGPNVSINNSILTGGGIEITSSNVSITGGTVGGITVTSSAFDVVISGVDIASSSAVGIDVQGQEVTITGPDFLGDIATPILLAVGANAGVKPPDISKVWRKMSEDETELKEIVGIVDGVGTVELFKNGVNEILYQKPCGVNLKENTNYSNSDLVPANSKIFVCKDPTLQVKDHVSFTFTDSNGNTSAMSNYIKLADVENFPATVPAPPIDLPTTAGIQDTPLPTDEEIEGQQLTSTVGDGIDGADAKMASSCKASLTGTSICDPNQLLMLLFPLVPLFLKRIFYQ